MTRASRYRHVFSKGSIAGVSSATRVTTKWPLCSECLILRLQLRSSDRSLARKRTDSFVGLSRAFRFKAISRTAKYPMQVNTFRYRNVIGSSFFLVRLLSSRENARESYHERPASRTFPPRVDEGVLKRNSTAARVSSEESRLDH